MNSRWVKSESIIDENNYNNKTVTNEKGAQLPKPGGPLKPRLDAVQKRIQVQIGRLEEIHNLLVTKDNELFQKLMVSIREDNTQRCTILSSELTNSRQTSRVVLSSCIALERLMIKLSTASAFGDLVIILGPAMAIIKTLRSSLTPYIPEMEEELGVVSELLSGILVDAGQAGGYIINFAEANAQAVSHIEEASLAVDQKIERDLPRIPELPIVSLKLF